MNFTLYTLPIEVLDLVFSEITAGILALHRGGWLVRDKGGKSQLKGAILVGAINETPDEYINAISKHWLRDVNMESFS